jgi:hypothetical protein
MDQNSPGIESELLDLSTIRVGTVRTAEVTGIAAAIVRVRDRIADSAESISGYNPSTGGSSESVVPEAEDPID